MKTITLKTKGYVCLKTGLGFTSLAEFVSYKAKQANQQVLKIFKAVKLEEKIEKAKAKLTTPFRRYCAKVVALRNYSQWLFSLPKSERLAFKYN